MKQPARVTQLVSEHFGILAPAYDRKSANREQYRAAIDDIVVELVSYYSRKSPKIKILDVATATGTRIEALRPRFPEHTTVFACDLNPDMVEIAKTKNLDDVRVANMNSLPYPDQYFNFVFCLFGSFGYLPNAKERLAALKEFNRVLKPGGFAAFDVVNRWHVGEGKTFRKSRLQTMQELAASAVRPSREWGDIEFKSKTPGEPTAGFFHAFTQKEVARLLVASDLAVIDAAVIGYETGQRHNRSSKGNLLYIVQKAA